jgi:hypothetical protein
VKLFARPGTIFSSNSKNKISVVSSPVVRQLVMLVVDKIVVEDADEIIPPTQLSKVRLLDAMTKPLGPSARDVFSVFDNLCLLINAEKPHFLKTPQTQRPTQKGICLLFACIQCPPDSIPPELILLCSCSVRSSSKPL